MKRTRRSTPDPFLFWKVAIFFLAAGVWVAGVITGRPWITGAAIVLLLAGLALRYAGREREEDAENS